MWVKWRNGILRYCPSESDTQYLRSSRSIVCPPVFPVFVFFPRESKKLGNREEAGRRPGQEGSYFPPSTHPSVYFYHPTHPINNPTQRRASDNRRTTTTSSTTPDRKEKDGKKRKETKERKRKRKPTRARATAQATREARKKEKKERKKKKRKQKNFPIAFPTYHDTRTHG